jgi:hypothetical protein
LNDPDVSQHEPVHQDSSLATDHSQVIRAPWKQSRQRPTIALNPRSGAAEETMGKRGLRYIHVGFVLALIAGQADGKEPPLTVRMCNFGIVDSDILFRAAAEARRIFQDAGVDTEWVTAADPRRLDPSILTVQLFGGHSRRSEAKDAFGMAILTKEKLPFLADIFFGTIEDVASTRTEEAILLGHVMAHEVGHLLLGTEHTSGTIMSAGLGSRDLPDMEAGRLRFSRRQSERLRAAVALRQSGAVGSSIGLPSAAPN